MPLGFDPHNMHMPHTRTPISLQRAAVLDLLADICVKPSMIDPMSPDNEHGEEPLSTILL
jgi:hypothetical protein